MITGEGNIVIKRPVEDVWNFLTDFEKYPKWHRAWLKPRKLPKVQ